MPHRQTLGVLLRHLTDLLDGDVEEAYREGGLVYRPRFTPVVHLLIEKGPSSIRAISEFGGITHSAASQTISEMVKRGLVRSEPGKDGRERIVRLTEAGEALLPQLRVHWAATNAAAAELIDEVGIPLPDVLEKVIGALEKRPFLKRIHEHRKAQRAPDAVPARRSPARAAAR